MHITNRGIVYGIFKDYSKAITDYTKAIEINSNNADVYSNRGLVYAILQDYSKAISDCNKAIELNPTDASTCLTVALLLVSSKTTPKQYRILQKQLE